MRLKQEIEKFKKNVFLLEQLIELQEELNEAWFAATHKMVNRHEVDGTNEKLLFNKYTFKWWRP